MSEHEEFLEYVRNVSDTTRKILFRIRRGYSFNDEERKMMKILYKNFTKE